MAPSPPVHDHTGKDELVSWLEDEANHYIVRKKGQDIDGVFPSPHYWAPIKDRTCLPTEWAQWAHSPIKKKEMEDSLDEICKSLSAHYFNDELAEYCSVFRAKDLKIEGDKLDGYTTVHKSKEDGEGYVQILLDFEGHKTNKALIETFLHEMVHAWVILKGNAFGNDECEENACKLRIGATGHGRDWLVMSRKVEVRAKKLHGESFRLGRLDGIEAEMVAAAGGKVENRMHVMLEEQLGRRKYLRALGRS